MNWLFYFAVCINAITILITVSEIRMMSSTFQNMDGESIPMDSGMTTYGKLISWLIPLGLFALVGAGFWPVVDTNYLVWHTDYTD